MLQHFNHYILELDSRVCCSQHLESRICIVCFCTPHLVRDCSCETKWRRDCEWPNEVYIRWTSKLRLRHRRIRGSTNRMMKMRKKLIIFRDEGMSRRNFAHKIRWRNTRHPKILQSSRSFSRKCIAKSTYSWMFFQARHACTLHLFSENHFVFFRVLFIRIFQRLWIYFHTLAKNHW